MRTREEILKGENERLFFALCQYNPVIFFERVLGYTAKDFHKEWIDILTKHKEIALSAPTGSGKTTCFGVFWPIYLCFFKPNQTVLIISRSIRTQSSTVLEEIKSIIEQNEFLKDLVPEAYKTSWTKEKIIMTNGSRILYSSFSINVRGIQADYVFADEVASYDNHELFFRDVLTRIISKNGQIAAVSTPLTTSDLLARLMNTPGFYLKVYYMLVNSEGLPDLKGKSIWPEKFPESYLLEKRTRIGIANFERNYMGNPKAEASESPVFTLMYVEDCYDLTRSFTTKLEGGLVYIGCDFAISSGPRADFDCYTVIEEVNDVAIIKNIEVHKGLPMPAKAQRIKELTDMYKPTRVIIDESSLGGGFLQELISKGIPAYPQSFQSQARKKLLLQLKTIIENKLLVIPRQVAEDSTIAMTDLLTEELIGFREEESKITKVKHLVSTSAHDDTVMALAMACSGITFKQEFVDFIATDDDEEIKSETNEEEEIEEESAEEW